MAVDRSALDQQNLLDAQASVLGSMLIDSRCVGAVLAEVRPEYITQPTYRMIFDAILPYLEGLQIGIDSECVNNAHLYGYFNLFHLA